LQKDKGLSSASLMYVLRFRCLGGRISIPTSTTAASFPMRDH
jgi:hypothetical protein